MEEFMSLLTSWLLLSIFLFTTFFAIFDAIFYGIDQIRNVNVYKKIGKTL